MNRKISIVLALCIGGGIWSVFMHRGDSSDLATTDRGIPGPASTGEVIELTDISDPDNIYLSVTAEKIYESFNGNSWTETTGPSPLYMFGHFWNRSGASYINQLERKLNDPEIIALARNGDAAGYTTLMFVAADVGYATTPHCIEQLLFLGADLDARNCFGQTALMYAAKYRNFYAARCLIEKGADVNIQDELGRSALMFTILQKDYELAKMLLNAGADEYASTHAMSISEHVVQRGDFLTEEPVTSVQLARQTMRSDLIELLENNIYAH